MSTIYVAALKNKGACTLKYVMEYKRIVKRLIAANVFHSVKDVDRLTRQLDGSLKLALRKGSSIVSSLSDAQMRAAERTYAPGGAGAKAAASSFSKSRRSRVNENDVDV